MTSDNPPLLLDTCAMIWMVGKAKMSAQSIAAIADAEREHTPIFLSPISFLEVGTLIARARVDLTVQAWYNELRRHPGIRPAEMPADMLPRSAFLPGTPPKDPTDRVIIQTAIEYGYRIVTRDREILDYAARNQVPRIAC